jgi:hypothetical protein
MPVASNLMSLVGQNRLRGHVGSNVRFAESGHSGQIGARLERVMRHCHRSLKMEYRRGSLRPDVRGPDHIAPLLGFVGKELAEVGRRAC